MNQVTASAPGKLLLLGDHAVVYGYPCVVTAVDQRLSVTIERHDQDLFLLTAPDVGLSAYSQKLAELGRPGLPKSVAFIEMLYKRFLQKYPQTEGVRVTTRSQFSSLFGFGSSSAVTVAFAKALSELYEIPLTNKQLFELCYASVIDVQGVGSGFDIAAAIWGGTLYYVTPAAVVEPVSVTELPVVVGYTGIKADTPTIIRMVESLKHRQPETVEALFSKSQQLVESAKEAIQTANWSELGQVMTQNQQLLQQLNVSSDKLDRLITAAETAGSFGAKLSGAGGGDCMIAVTNTEHQAAVEAAITAAEGTVMDVTLNAQGVRIE